VSSDPADDAVLDDDVLEANLAFYGALEAGDLEAMSALWGHGDDVVCAHPGRPPVRGWTDVRRSWQAIFDGGGNPQVIVTDAEVGRRGSTAWVTATENLLTGRHTAATTALNIFHLDDSDPSSFGGWKLVAHHAGPIMGS
jgi:ketosteroid isomerase-like protein